MEIEFTKTARKFINAQDTRTKKRIREAIHGLTENPPNGDIKPLQGYSDGRKRLRKGGFRIIFNFISADSEVKSNEKLLIIDIGVRGDIYK